MAALLVAFVLTPHIHGLMFVRILDLQNCRSLRDFGCMLRAHERPSAPPTIQPLLGSTNADGQ